MLKSWRAVGAWISLLLTSCGGATETAGGIARLEVVPASALVFVDRSLQLTATVLDAAGNLLGGRVITWTTSASGVATVSSGGVVTGVGEGRRRSRRRVRGRAGRRR
jgi:trimeric autotransporter adhesin